MNVKKANSSESNKLGLILGLLSTLMALYFACQNLQIQSKSEFLILGLFLLGIIIVPVYITFSITSNYFKQKRTKIKCDWINPKIQPTTINEVKILAFIKENKSVTKLMIITKFKYSNKIAKRYLKYLVTNKYIKIKLSPTDLSKQKFRMINKSENEYIIDNKGELLIETVSNFKIPPNKINIPQYYDL
jgi:hypothetical protein